MRALSIITLVALIGVLVPPALTAADTGIEPEKMDAIERLLEASGEVELVKQGMLGMIDQIRESPTELPPEFFDEFKKAVLSDELKDVLAPIYDRHYTLEEIEQLIKFYESPIGRTMVKRQPLVQQDAMGVGRHWGQKKAAEIVERLRERGVILPGDTQE